MPTKHIDEATWRKVEKETVNAVTTTRAALKDTEVLKILILKGLENVTKEDYAEFLKIKGRL